MVHVISFKIEWLILRIHSFLAKMKNKKVCLVVLCASSKSAPKGNFIKQASPQTSEEHSPLDIEL